MKKLSTYSARQFVILFVFSLGFLAGCESTPDENCQAENCEEQEPQPQPSYNPCKVNKNLPQCE